MVGKLAIAALLLEVASAFPNMAQQAATLKEEKRGNLDGKIPFPENPGSPAHALFNDFDPVDQHVSTTGVHRWIAPGPNDIRGPCAGLNAAANHGYIPRSGIANADAINTGLEKAFGLDKTATLFLQTATMFFDGDPLSGRWSIGYHSDKTQSLGALGNALGNETGICGYGHLKTEGDASITRGDWLAPEMNSNCASYPTFMQGLLDLAKKVNGPSGIITPPMLALHQYQRKQHSIATNPNYFSPVYAGVAFTFGAHMFAYELLANRSAEHPRGLMTPENFLTWWSYTRSSSGALEYTYGHERIPDNFYKRSSRDMWTLEDIAISTAQNCASYPSSCAVGGNTGKVNSFDGIDPGDISGGLIRSAKDLSDPGRMGCFIAQAVQADVPSFLDKVMTGAALTAALAKIQTTLIPSMAPLTLTCPNLPKGKSVLQYGAKYPGAQFVGEGPRNPY